MPRVRFTVRRLMLATAILAVVMGPATALERRRDRFADRARGYTDRAYLRVCEPPAHRDAEAEAAWHRREQRRQDPRTRERLMRLALKYERAARYPWLPVAPDPPEPE